MVEDGGEWQCVDAGAVVGTLAVPAELVDMLSERLAVKGLERADAEALLFT